jgi:hypothetical protein
MHNLKFKAIIKLGETETEIEEISVCHFNEEKEIDERVLSFLSSGDDYIWLENSFTIIQIK